VANDLRSWFARQRAPFTLFLAVSIGVAALVALLSPQALVGLTFSELRPWGVLTYPWAMDLRGSSMGLISLVFLIVLLLQFGSTTEGEMGTGRFAAFWGAAALMYGLLGAALHVAVYGPWLPSSVLIVAWCARNPNATIMLYGILPLRGTWIAGLTALGVVVSYGAQNPPAAIAMLLPLGLAWLFAADRLPLGYRAGNGGGGSRRQKFTVVRGAKEYDDGYFDDVKARELEREERERLRKLFEGK